MVLTSCGNVRPMHPLQIQHKNTFSESVTLVLITPKYEHLIPPNTSGMSVPGQRNITGALRSGPTVPDRVESEQLRAGGAIVTAAPYVDFVVVEHGGVPVTFVR